jgi:hypothetical protein
MFPLADNMPHSWEGHLWGFLAGLVAALVYRKEGPQKPPPPFAEEEEEEGDAPAFWEVTPKEEA